MNNRIKTIIFTDLDGTLLDYSTYSFEAAMPALKRLQECGIPLVIVSSKTRAEIEPLLAELPPLSKLFITENGSAVYLDRQSPVPPGIQAELRAGYRAIILGCRYDEVLSALREAQSQCKANVKGFSDMSVREVARLTGLDTASAGLAKNREFSEPFMFRGTESKLECLKSKLDESGMNCLEGGRLFHALGRTDKGAAVRLVIDLYRRTSGGAVWKTIALGDGPNDIDMLRCADVAAVMRRQDGTWMEYHPSPSQRVIMPAGIGPAGWNEAVLTLLKEQGCPM